MNNPQDQPGQSNQTNADRTNQNASTGGGTSATSRKSAPMPGAQSTSASSDAQHQTTANAGTSRQGEGQQTNSQEGTLLDTALESGKKWIEDSGALDKVNQLPQGFKNLGNRALDKVNSLSTTQKVVGGAILAAGIGWLATRKGKDQSASSDSSAYNYGRQRDAGYGRNKYGYQAPDASNSRRNAGRADSGAPYASSSTRRFGNEADKSGSANTGIQSGSGHSDSGSGFGSASARTDHGTQPRSGSEFGSSTDE